MELLHRKGEVQTSSLLLLQRTMKIQNVADYISSTSTKNA